MKIKSFTSLLTASLILTTGFSVVSLTASKALSEPSTVTITQTYDQPIKGTGEKVYMIRNGYRQWIINPETLDALGFAFSDIKTIADSQLSQYPRGSLLATEGTLVKGSGDKVYEIWNGRRRWITGRMFRERRLSFSNVINISDEELQAIPESR